MKRNTKIFVILGVTCLAMVGVGALTMLLYVKTFGCALLLGLPAEC